LHEAFTKTRPAAAARRGVTLMELAIVVVIISAMLVFSVPNMRGLHEKNKLISSTRKIVSLMRYARSEAITREYETEIRFDTEKGRYRLDLNVYKYTRVMGSGDRQSQKREQIEQIQTLPRYVDFQEITTGEDPEGKEKIPRIIFHPNGTSTGATIVLRNKTPRKGAPVRMMGIDVPYATGLPEVYSVDKEGKRKEEEQGTPRETGEQGEQVTVEDFDQFLREFEP